MQLRNEIEGNARLSRIFTPSPNSVPSGRTGEAGCGVRTKYVDSVRHWVHGELSASSETGDTG